MNKLVLIGSAFCVFSSFAGESKFSRSEYVESWKKVAIEQMEEHNIPASITLAQGILESGSGNSELALKGNNHFGIKCHGWEGKQMFLDDDSKNECFRVYKHAQESYEDHSDFLKKYDRYKFLFTYEVTDYKSWAHGLKKAGYATNSKYPQLLIDIIEDLELSEFDYINVPNTKKGPSLIAESKKIENNVNAHQVYNHENRVKYVVAKGGDTFYKIAKEFGLNLKQLSRYNDFRAEKDVIEEGDVIYIQPKRRGSLFKKKEMIVSSDLTLIELSQVAAVKVKSIKRLNDFTSNDEQISAGMKITLR
jgi:LysM repeat protein